MAKQPVKKTSQKKELLSDLKPEHKIFAEAYIYDWNATRAYKKAYPKVNDATAAANGCRLLKSAKILALIDETQKDISKIAGVSALRNMTELAKIAYSSLHNYQSNWMTLKDWDMISEDDKAAVSEITHTTTEINGVSKTLVKFKLHDKKGAIEILNKMVGSNGVEKIDLTTNGESLNLSQADREKRINELVAKAKGK